MKLSKERLEKESVITGFRPEILEKVIHLMELLNDFMYDSFLSTRIALKGGTALNLFCYDLPCLSVDIDINYIGSVDKNKMLHERNKIIETIETICLDKNYVSQRKPNEHAGGKWRLRYNSDLSNNPRIEIDLNFLTRLPLWAVKNQCSVKLGSYQTGLFPVLDKHELAGGKLKALFSRHSSRDLFDTYYLLKDKTLNHEKLRIAFIVYGAMSRTDWRTIQIDAIQYEWIELKNNLLPMLRKKVFETTVSSKTWANQLLTITREKLSQLLPLRSNEITFLNDLLDNGEINPHYLTDDPILCANIKKQPPLHWKAFNVKKMKSLDKEQTKYMVD